MRFRRRNPTVWQVQYTILDGNPHTKIFKTEAEAKAWAEGVSPACFAAPRVVQGFVGSKTVFFVTNPGYLILRRSQTDPAHGKSSDVPGRGSGEVTPTGDALLDGGGKPTPVAGSRRPHPYRPVTNGTRV